MTHRRDFLEKCYALSLQGWFKNFRSGVTVARGFADVGFEEFFILHNFKIVSLLSGDISDFSEESKEHFFVVPTANEIISECRLRNITLQKLELQEDGDWIAEFHSSSKQCKTHRSSLESVLIDGILTIYEYDNPRFRLTTQKGSFN